MANRLSSILSLSAVLAASACSRDRPTDVAGDAAAPAPSAAAPASAAAPPSTASAASAEPVPADDTPCPLRFGEKKGVRFVSLCGSDKLWLSAEPVACAKPNAGLCPETLALGPSPKVEAGVSVASARPTSIVEVAAARAECASRFGGRLPTQPERAAMSRRFGLETLLVAELPYPAQGFRFEQLREWVTASACAADASECKTETFPAAAPSWDLPWSAARSCDASPARDAATERGILIGHVCPAVGFVWTTGSSTEPGPRPLPCAVRTGPSALFNLTCRPAPKQPDAGATPSSDTISAFRCVVPESALTKVGAPEAVEAAPRPSAKPPEKAAPTKKK